MRNTMHLRAASLAPDTFDEAERTIEVVLSTGADVARPGYVERLPIAAADLRSIAGKPVLDAHAQHTTRSVLGVIQKAWKKDGEIRALLKLSSRDDVAGTVRDIADGILRSLSVGYRVSKWADSTNSKGERIRTALAWIIHEASFVPIGADAGAVTRSNPMKKAKTGAGLAPTKEQIEAAYEAVRDLPPGSEVPAGIFDTIAFAVNDNAKAQTRAAIRDIIKRAGGTTEQADELIDAEATEEQARAAAYELMQTRSNSAPRVRVISSNEDPAVNLDRRAEGLACRAGGVKPSDAARPFVALSIADHARDMAEAAGIRTRGMTNEQILTRAMHTISDFSGLLTDTGARLLKPAYEAASSPLVGLTRKVQANDFRSQYGLQLGELPKLSKVSESGEIKSVTRGEAKETWALETYGAIFSLSRKALINDDLNAFADFATAAGQAAAATVADLLVSVLTQANGQGPVMGDGNRLFDYGEHGNAQEMAYNTLTPGLVESFANAIASARIAMLLQKGVDGQTIINVRPDTIIVPPSLLTTAEQAIATITPTTVDAVSPVQSKFAIVCEPRLEAVSATQWYVADSSLAALVLGGLAGNEGPQFASREGFDVLGREFRVTLDVGVGPNDWRGWLRTVAESSNSDF